MKTRKQKRHCRNVKGRGPRRRPRQFVRARCLILRESCPPRSLRPPILRHHKRSIYRLQINGHAGEKHPVKRSSCVRRGDADRRRLLGLPISSTIGCHAARPFICAISGVSSSLRRSQKISETITLPNRIAMRPSYSVMSSRCVWCAFRDRRSPPATRRSSCARTQCRTRVSRVWAPSRPLRN